MFSNPILKNFKSFLFYLLFWLIITAMYINLLNFIKDIDFGMAVLDSIVFNLLLAGMALSFWYPAKYISFEDNSLGTILLSHSLSGFFASFLWISIGYLIVSAFWNNNNVYTEFFFSTLSWRFLIGLLIYFLIVSFYYLVIYYNQLQSKTVKEVELNKLITEAELKSLKFQINPHFIFNSLNSMSALTAIDPSKAQQMILKLSEFLRYTLANNVKQKNNLKEELINVKRYLDIEKIRFEDKFEFVEEMNEKCLNVEVPNMILQPLFENAIKHAVYEALEKVTIKLSCRIENNYLTISLTNNFENETSIKGAGVGINNIKERLELIYYQKDLMQINKSENQFEVVLYIPV